MRVQRHRRDLNVIIATPEYAEGGEWESSMKLLNLNIPRSLLRGASRQILS